MRSINRRESSLTSKSTLSGSIVSSFLSLEREWIVSHRCQHVAIRRSLNTCVFIRRKSHQHQQEWNTEKDKRNEMNDDHVIPLSLPFCMQELSFFSSLIDAQGVALYSILSSFTNKQSSPQIIIHFTSPTVFSFQLIITNNTRKFQSHRWLHGVFRGV